MKPKFAGTLPEVFVSTPALSGAISRGMKDGSLRRLGPRLYTQNLADPPPEIVRRHLWQLVSALVPGALIADRTALDCRPAEDGSIFVIADRKRDLELPGVAIRPREGSGPLAGSDMPFIGDLFMSSEARAYLDNLAPSRRRDGRARRTLSPDELETRLDEKIRSHGAEALNRIRDQARALAPKLGREAELVALERIVAGLLGTQARGRARQAGKPFDPDRLRRFEVLQRELQARAPRMRLARDRDGEGRGTLAFFEAYFSNFIEGTQFAVDEAADIVFRNMIPRHRPEDAHDVAGTWRVVSDLVEMSVVPEDPAQLVTLLRRRHATVMTARPEKLPGVFKLAANQAGSTSFVAPELVEGTLIHGFDLYRGLDSPLARAIYMMFMVAEVHPFTDGNGRTARIMMNAELVAAREERIIIPTVLRDSYISALKALSHRDEPAPLIRNLEYAQRWVAGVPWGPLRATTTVLTRCHAFLDPLEADERGVGLRIPDVILRAEEDGA